MKRRSNWKRCRTPPAAKATAPASTTHERIARIAKNLPELVEGSPGVITNVPLGNYQFWQSWQSQQFLCFCFPLNFSRTKSQARVQSKCFPPHPRFHLHEVERCVGLPCILPACLFWRLQFGKDTLQSPKAPLRTSSN